MLSVLYYINPTWPADWKGPTLFFRRGTPIGRMAGPDIEAAEHVVDYVPGRFAVFPSAMPHSSTPPTNGCKELRMTLSYVIENVKVKSNKY